MLIFEMGRLFILTMLERIQKILSRAGITSRRAAERLILNGQVAINGNTVSTLGTKADPDTDIITLDGTPISVQSSRTYILLNKPAGYVTTLHDPDGRPIVTDILKDIPERLFPVGRLDFNTEGILLLTNDGDWAHKLAHPSHEIIKEYHVKVRGKISAEILNQLTNGVKLDDGWTAPAQVELLRTIGKNAWLSISIHEGRYRQVRRMCEKVGLLVAKLARVKYGNLVLGSLKTGEYRHLTNIEVKSLLSSQPDKQHNSPNRQKSLHTRKKHDT
jgi:23S rRNA pseudouridine2605 synthase